MKKKRILELIPILPNDVPYLNKFAGRMTDMACARQALVEKHFYCLNDVRFGWHFVNAFIDTRRRLPPDVYDVWLLRAYTWLMGESDFDTPIRDAIILDMPQNSGVRDVVQASMLISKFPLKKLAKMVDVSVDTLNAYVELFYNIRNRLNEETFVKCQVYPQGRRVEFTDGYIQREDSNSQLKRLAIEHGIGAMRSWAGYSSGHLVNAAPEAESSRLEAAFMGSANLLAKLGGVNQRGLPAMNGARNMITAAKAGGAVEVTPPNALGLAGVSNNPGISILSDLARINGKEKDPSDTHLIDDQLKIARAIYAQNTGDSKVKAL